MNVGPLKAVVAGFIVATVVTFVGNRQWAFRHRQGKGLGHETVLFMVLNVVGLIIQEAVVGLVHYGLSLTDAVSYNIALVIGIGLGTLFRLWSYRRWVFPAVPGAPTEAEHLEPQRL
jgi:putative flippase GtrA